MEAVVLMTDFGLYDRFVASMKGVIYSISPSIPIFDLTHQIRPYALEEASEILAGTIPYWPPGTVFVAVVDPGVGTSRKSIGVKLSSGQLVITPDNGTLTHTLLQLGIDSIHEIDEIKNRRPGTGNHHTFHGRDIYAYNGARLAAGLISLAELGPVLNANPVMLDLWNPVEKLDRVEGFITRIEKPYGNLSTNIPEGLFLNRGWICGKDKILKCIILQNEKIMFEAILPLVRSFGWVQQNKPLIYSDSVSKIGLAINQGNMAKKYKVGAGKNWKVIFSDEVEKHDGDEW